jgi:cytochrome o ubiquinol oxidase subunit 3
MSSHAGTIDHHHDPSTSTGIPNKKLIMWAFLASDCMFFGDADFDPPDLPPAPAPGGLDPTQVVFSLELTSFSTFILLMSSLMMALAVTAIQKNNVKSCRWSLLATILFGMIFLGCQVYEFDHFVVAKKMTLSNSLLGSTFYTLTGTHGCHVAIGVLWLSIMYVRSFKAAPSVDKTGAWFGKNLIHVVVLLAALPALAEGHSGPRPRLIEVDGLNGTAIAHFFKAAEFLSVAGTLVSIGILIALPAPPAPVDFDERHADRRRVDGPLLALRRHRLDRDLHGRLPARIPLK